MIKTIDEIKHEAIVEKIKSLRWQVESDLRSEGEKLKCATNINAPNIINNIRNLCADWDGYNSLLKVVSGDE